MSNFMSYKGYTTSMVYDTEDKIIAGRVQDVDDIISFHGESVAEFESNFHSAIDDYLATSNRSVKAYLNCVSITGLAIASTSYRKQMF